MNLSLSKRIRAFEKAIERSESQLLDMTFGYPIDLHADWMEEYVSTIRYDLLTTVDAKVLHNNICDYFAQLFGYKDYFITTSASEALMIAIHSCVENQNDEIILFDYGFYSYPELIKSSKGKPIFAQRDAYENPVIQSVFDCFSEKTRAVIITQPENPLGRIFDKNELEQLCLFCIEKKVTLIVDHAFIESAFYGHTVNLLLDLDYNTFLKDLSWIVIGDTGKTVCLQGIKCGCLLVSDNLKEKIESWAHLFLFQSDRVKLFILSKILHDPRLESYKTELATKMVENLKLLASKLDTRVHIFYPQATPMVLLDISHFAMDDISFTERLLQEESVALMPGCYFVYGLEKQNHYQNAHVRIAISRPKHVLEEAIFRINRFLSALHQQ